MRKFYLFTLLLTILGTVYFSPTLAQSTQEADTTSASPSETTDLSTQPSEAVPSDPTSTSGESADVTTPVQEQIDYSELEEALQRRDWQAADEATYLMMLKIAGSTSEAQGVFDSTEWRNFSCDDLRRIDSLWSEASRDELGFSAQKRILESVGRNSRRYYDAIGWRLLRGDWLVSWTLNEDTKRVEYLPGKMPNFEDPPLGHLPAKLQWRNGTDLRFQKIYSCNL